MRTPPRARPFRQVDVFTAERFLGNPLAVILDGQDLDDARMQAITNWTNLSEATFLLPPLHPDADYRVRIFAPNRELPFAGHPTLGSCHAWLEHGGQAKVPGRIIQECGIGLVTLRQSAGRLAFAAPALRRSGPLDEADVARIARGLGISRSDIVDHAWCDNGPNWRGILLDSAEQVLALRPDPAILAGLDVGVVGPHRNRAATGTSGADSAAVDFEVRAFFPVSAGMAEDPVTGSLNAALALWLIGSGRAPRAYTARQGTALGRDGRVYVEQDSEGQTWIGGDSVSCVSGVLYC